jgi:hypothetical protein
MNNEPANEEPGAAEEAQQMGRRLFLQSVGKWSGAAIAAALGGTWVVPSARAAVWVNRRVYGGGAWVNGVGWVNGAGGWINRSAWVNRRAYGGGTWVNRW